MKIAILNDTHCGIRNSSDIFLDNAAKFYGETFFPYLKEHDIKQIVHLGDYYDNRKAINIKCLNHNRKHFLEPLRDLGIRMDIIPGNHDTYFKDTNTPNSLKELLGFFINEVAIIEKPTVIEYQTLRLALLPWMTKDNWDESINFIKNCKADILGGHLELNGFEMMRGIKNDHGMDASIFSRFESVFSGHYHTKNSGDNIHYLGSQMEFFWSDCNDKKYFHILDTETRELTAVQNPHTLFKKVVYNDTKYDYNRIPDFSGHFVKVVVVNKTKPQMFEAFIDKLQDQNLHDLKIAENFDHMIGYDESADVAVDDTQTLLDDYIEASETNLDKSHLKTKMRDLYTEAQSIEIL
jgi:DNA repair exonuclease SbcCD nuclease subunit